MDAVVDRLVVGRKHEKAIKAAIAATLLVGDGLLQVQIIKGASKADADKFYKSLCSATHHFVYGDIEPSYFVFNEPESCVSHLRRTRRLQADASGAAGPRSQAKHSRRLFREGGVQVQSRHVGRARDVQPVEGDRILARHAVGEAARRGARTRILNGIDQRKLTIVRAAGSEGQSRAMGRQRSRLSGHRAAHRTLLSTLSPARRSELRDGGVARQGDGRAHVSRLQRRAPARDAPAVHDLRQDDLRRRTDALRRAARSSSAR